MCIYLLQESECIHVAIRCTIEDGHSGFLDDLLELAIQTAVDVQLERSPSLLGFVWRPVARDMRILDPSIPLRQSPCHIPI